MVPNLIHRGFFAIVILAVLTGIWLAKPDGFAQPVMKEDKHDTDHHPR